MKFRVFTRTWWKKNPAFYQGLEPCPGRKTTIGVYQDEETARQVAQRWNREHKPGLLSRKAEYEEVRHVR